jgi:RimJ/RimL family protein N-acetyltransferase
VLTGERVVLRPFRPEDREPIWRSRLDPLAWAKTTEAPYVPETLEAYRERHAQRGQGSNAEFAVDVDGVLVGRAGLFGVDDLARMGEIGLSILPDAQGQGHGRDVLRVLLGYGFRSRNLRRIHLQTLASNEPALRCYRAVGFVEEGRLREHAWVEGAYDDVVLMAVLRSEWSGQTSSPSR